MEYWLAVVGWEGIYEVSDLGKVRRIAPVNGRPTTREMKQIMGAYGYTYTKMRHMGRYCQRLTHKVVAEAFLGPCPTGMQVNHKDGNRANAAASNLEYMTPSDNHKHAYRVLGRSKVRPKGERNRNAKLSCSQVSEIRSKYAAGGISQQSIADAYGISQGQVSMITRGVSWTDVTP